MASKKKSNIVTPDLEVLVRSNNREVAAVAFFKDGNSGLDILVGMESFDLRLPVATALRQSADAVEEALQLEGTATEDFTGGKRPWKGGDIPC